MGLVAFTKTLAREGAKYNINATVIAPVGITCHYSANVATHPGIFHLDCRFPHDRNNHAPGNPSTRKGTYPTLI